MKSLFSLCLLLFLISSAFAQQIPNGNFRYWEARNPTGWGTWASAVYPHNVSLGDSMSILAQKDTTSGDFVDDSIALRMTVDTFNLPSQGHVTLRGFASLGGAGYVAPPTGAGLQYNMIRYGLKPDTLFIDYKYSIASGIDTALVVMSLTRWDTLTHSRKFILSHAMPLTDNASWQRDVAFPLLPYYNFTLPDTLLPDSMQLVILASTTAFPALGTTLWVDTVHFETSITPVVTGIPDLNSVKDISIYPNPSGDELYIAVAEQELGSLLRMYDASGRQVYGGVLDRYLSRIDTHDLPPGTYTLRISGRDALTVYRSTVSIVH